MSTPDPFDPHAADDYRLRYLLAVSSRRSGVVYALDQFEKWAQETGDTVAETLVLALRRIHDLYPEADDLEQRGTPQHQARVDIHNIIAAAIAEVAERCRAERDGKP